MTAKTLPLKPGEVPWKEFVHREADRLGLSYIAMQSRISRRKHPMDYRTIRRGPTGRAIAVQVK